MTVLRGKLPSRRPVPTRKPRTDWTKHKPDLQEDFNFHCGYCDSYDGFSHTYFEVDHFVPKDEILKNKWPITLVEYSNLVYACKFCNNNKLAQWPSGSYTVFKKYNKGYVDPCDTEYDTHLFRKKNGEIMWKTALGKWMYSFAFKFDQRRDGIKLLWNLNRLRKAIEDLEEKRDQHGATTRKYQRIQKEINELSGIYVPQHRELIAYYRSL